MELGGKAVSVLDILNVPTGVHLKTASISEECSTSFDIYQLIRCPSVGSFKGLGLGVYGTTNGICTKRI